MKRIDSDLGCVIMAGMEKGFRLVGGACGIASGALFIVAIVLAFIEPQFPGLDPQASLEAIGRDPIGFLIGISPSLALPFLIIVAALGFYRAMRDGRGGFALAGSGLAIAGSTVLAVGVVIRVFSGLALAYLYSAVIPSQQPLVVGLAEVVGVFLYWGFLALPYAFFGIAQIAFSGSMLGDPVPKWYGVSGIVLGLVTVAGMFLFQGLPAAASLAAWFILVGQKVIRLTAVPGEKPLA